MANALDVAAYILKKGGEMTTMKLQKLVYYSQAWHLVWDERPLFRDRIEAWANGPIVPRLYREHRGVFKLRRLGAGSLSALNQDERETVNAVLKFYGDRTSQYLSDLTHMEDPWKDARRGLPEGERSNREITHAAMFNYYSTISPSM